MADISLTASTRTELGRHVHALRRRGEVPAILYGHNLEARPIQADAKQLERIWQRAGRTHLIDLRLDGERPRKVLIRTFDTDPRTGRVLHADFFAVNLREKLTADVPIVVIGESPIVAANEAQLQQIVTHIRIECLPTNLPAQLSVDVSGLTEIDQGVTLGEVPLPEGVALVHADPAELVVKVAPLRVTVEPATEAEAEAAGETAGEPPTAEAAEEQPPAEG